MYHRNEYSYKYANTQNNAGGQVGERWRVAVPTPFAQDRFAHELTGGITRAKEACAG
jgi:hypothetical protein